MLSPLTQGRGLKHVQAYSPGELSSVAPHTGAWIETTAIEGLSTASQEVAPHTGAWIETRYEDYLTENKATMSPLTQGRGLKQGDIALTVLLQ